MQPDDLCFATAIEIAELVAAREVSPVDLVAAQLDRIQRYDPLLSTFVTLDGERALQQAKAVETEIAAGSYRGTLHGLTVAHKDIIDVAGVRTTNGSVVIPPRVAGRDAHAAGRLRAAGTVCLGKLNLLEYASGSMGPYGITRNPWRLSANPGGSSSGSGAAVAAGLVHLSTGTDTGGSIRAPACATGVVGLRPTYGRVSRHGVTPLSWSQDAVGPLARSVADIAVALSAMAGTDAEDPTSAPRPVPAYDRSLDAGLAGWRLGVPDSYFLTDLDPEVDEAMDAALGIFEELGAELRPVSLPSARLAPSASWVLAYSEAFEVHRSGFLAHADRYTRPFVTKIAAAGMTSAAEVVLARQVRRLVTQEFHDALDSVDALVLPTSRTLASAWSRAVPPAMRTLPGSPEMVSVTRPVSLTGFPALSVPIGFARDATPIGVQLVGSPWQEASLLKIAHSLESASGWSRHHPDLDALSIENGPDADEARSGLVPEPAGGVHVTTGWVMDMARLLGYSFVDAELATDIASVLDPVKEQLRLSFAAVGPTFEPTSIPAGLDWR